jgi:prevent-host-death family protein
MRYPKRSQYKYAGSPIGFAIGLSTRQANAAGFLDQVRSTKRPLVLTQHGKSAEGALDVDQYEAMVDEIELIRDIRQAKAELARGEGMPHEEVGTQLRERLDR